MIHSPMFATLMALYPDIASRAAETSRSGHLPGTGAPPAAGGGFLGSNIYPNSAATSVLPPGHVSSDPYFSHLYPLSLPGVSSHVMQPTGPVPAYPTAPLLPYPAALAPAAPVPVVPRYNTAGYPEPVPVPVLQQQPQVAKVPSVHPPVQAASSSSKPQQTFRGPRVYASLHSPMLQQAPVVVVKPTQQHHAPAAAPSAVVHESELLAAQMLSDLGGGQLSQAQAGARPPSSSVDGGAAATSTGGGSADGSSKTKRYHHLTLADKYEIVQKLRYYDLEARTAKSICNMHHAVSVEYDVCESTIYQIVKQQDMIERKYFQLIETGAVDGGAPNGEGMLLTAELLSTEKGRKKYSKRRPSNKTADEGAEMAPTDCHHASVPAKVLSNDAAAAMAMERAQGVDSGAEQSVC